MRSATLVAFPLLLTAACLDSEPIGPILSCEAPILPSDVCVDARRPVDFYDDAAVVARGGTGDFDVLVLDGTEVALSSDDPAIAAVTETGPGTYAVRGVAVGATAIQARRPDGTILATMQVEVAALERVEFGFATAGAAPLPALAALPGAIERIRVMPVDARGRSLVGAEDIVEFTTEGPLAEAPVERGARRGGSIGLFDGDDRPGYDIAIEFTGLGRGELLAQGGEGPLGRLPIEVIGGPATVELRLAAPQVPTAWFQLVDLIGADPSGVPVAGLRASFAVTPAGLVEVPVGGVHQASLRTLAAGVATVTATLPSHVATGQFEIVVR
jgi:hypothetical protein